MLKPDLVTSLFKISCMVFCGLHDKIQIPSYDDRPAPFSYSFHFPPCTFFTNHWCSETQHTADPPPPHCLQKVSAECNAFPSSMVALVLLFPFKSQFTLHYVFETSFIQLQSSLQVFVPWQTVSSLKSSLKLYTSWYLQVLAIQLLSEMKVILHGEWGYINSLLVPVFYNIIAFKT